MVLIVLYTGRGKDASPDNLINISSLLYMYTVLPGFAAISYMPGLVLERPLYIRHATGAPALLALDVPMYDILHSNGSLMGRSQTVLTSARLV